MGEFIRLTAATLLGALISFGATFYFERRREQVAAEHEQSERNRQLRQAARLVRDELVVVGYLIDSTLESNEWWSQPPHDFPSQRWANHCPALAALLRDDDVWWSASLAYSEIWGFNVLMAMAREGKETTNKYIEQKHSPLEDPLNEAWRDSLERTRVAIVTALNALSPVERSRANTQGKQ